jgi:hypothetical protein
LLRDDREVVTDIYELKDDGLVYYYASCWFNTCRTTLEMLGETSCLDDTVLKDKTI